MQIATNLLSLQTQRNLEQTSRGLNQTLSRLSSGLRINTAKDDAAGLAISSRMTSIEKGDRQAIRNMSDGLSMMQVAEGVMSNITDSLQRVRELAVQASSGALSASDKRALQAEANQLLQEVTAQAEHAEFNGQKIFAQSSSSLGGDTARRGIVDGLRMGWLEESEQRISSLLGIKADNQELKIVFDAPAGSGLTSAPGGAAAAVGSLTGTADGNGRTLNQFLWIDPADFSPPNLPNGGGISMGNGTVYSDRIIAHEMVHAVMGRAMNFAALPNWIKEGMAEFIHGADERLYADTAAGTDVSAALAAFNADSVASSAGYSGGYLAVRYMHQAIKAAGGSGVKDVLTYLSNNTGSTLTQALTNASSGAFASLADFNTKFNTNAASVLAGVDLTNEDTGAIGGLDVDGGAALNSKNVFSDQGTGFSNQTLTGFKQVWADVTIGVNSNGGTGSQTVAFQIGNRDGQTLETQFGGMTAINLGLEDVDLVDMANFAIVHVDDALNYISNQRAKTGAVISRLESASSNLSAAVENTSAARSRILDADYAQETATLTRQQILQQAGTSMLSQANSSPQAALALLRGL